MTLDDATRIYSQTHNEIQVAGLKSRGKIIMALNRPRTASEIAARVGLPLSTVRGHLTILQRMGLVGGESYGGITAWSQTPLDGAKNGVSA